MNRSTKGQERKGRATRTANERWKQKWGSVTRWSAVAAVAAHVAVFAGWPTYQFTHSADTYMAPVQLVQLPLFDLPTDLLDGKLPVPREDEPIEEVVEIEQPDPLDLLETVAPALPALAVGGPEPLRPQFAAHTAAVSAPSVSLKIEQPHPNRYFSWPEILNPRDMVRFLRSRYNPIHTPTEADRFVSVAIWINEKGQVEWCEVHESSGHPTMDEIALTAVNEVLAFSPAHKEGVPISVAVVLSIPFQVQW
jgi:TonB family protein